MRQALPGGLAALPNVVHRAYASGGLNKQSQSEFVSTLDFHMVNKGHQYFFVYFGREA